MRQIAGKHLDVVVLAAKPVGDTGTDMTAFEAAMKCAKHSLMVTIPAGPALTVKLYVRDAQTDTWALATDTGVLGVLSGAALPGGDTYMFVIENLGVFDEIALVEATATATAKLAEIIENNFRRAD